MIAGNDVTLIGMKNVITDEYEISEAFHKHFVKLVVKSCRNKPNKTGTTLGSLNDSNVIDKVIES